MTHDPGVRCSPGAVGSAPEKVECRGNVMWLAAVARVVGRRDMPLVGIAFRSLGEGFCWVFKA